MKAELMSENLTFKAKQSKAESKLQIFAARGRSITAWGGM